jgi:hypothetical protein
MRSIFPGLSIEMHNTVSKVCLRTVSCDPLCCPVSGLWHQSLSSLEATGMRSVFLGLSIEMHNTVSRVCRRVVSSDPLCCPVSGLWHQSPVVLSGYGDHLSRSVSREAQHGRQGACPRMVSQGLPNLFSQDEQCLRAPCQ